MIPVCCFYNILSLYVLLKIYANTIKQFKQIQWRKQNQRKFVG